MIFCQIDNQLVDIIKKLARNRTIVDCGCGEGLLEQFIPDAIAIDIQQPDNPPKGFLHIDCVKFPFTKQEFPVFIRPCHGHFVKQVLYQNENIIECLYISHPSNVEIDIDEHEYRCIELDDWIGKDGEKIHRIIKKGYFKQMLNPIEKEKYYLVIRSDFPQSGAYWVKKTIERYGTCWQNPSGGRGPIDKDDQVVEIVEADSFEDLDWKKTCLYRPDEKSDYGWLDRSGNFFACDYEDHAIVACRIFGKYDQTLEAEGWVKLSTSYSDGWYHRGEVGITQEQGNWLTNNGFKVVEGDYRNFQQTRLIMDPRDYNSRID
jgi:hypothetical protein